MKPYISVVIPCYNEVENIRQGILGDIFKYLKRQSYTWELIVSDDGSTDESKNEIKRRIKKMKGFRLLQNPHGGKPSALYYGVKDAKGIYILFTDMDQSTPIDQLSKLLKYIEKNYDVIIGSRGLQRRNFPFYRKLGSFMFMSLRRLLILRDIKDTQCGFKLFKAKLLKEYFPKLEFFQRKTEVVGWMVTSWDVELLHMIKKKGYKIKEVLVAWNDKDLSKGKGSALSKYFKESKEMFFEVIRVKVNDWRGVYN